MSVRGKLVLQRFCGILCFGICAVVITLASTGLTVEDKDASAVLLFLPLGISCLFSKNLWLF